MDAAEALIREALRDGLRTESTMSVDEWADQYRFLSTEASAEPGPWRTSRVPYTREIMRCLSNGSPWERVVLMFGSQLSKTETANNWVGYVMDRAPGPMLYVMPTVDMAKELSKTRIDHMIASSPVLRDKVAEPRSRDGGNTILMKEYPGGYLGLTGANSPASLSSKPIRYVYLDEIDRYPGDVGGEGDPVNLAITRTRTFSRRKILVTSTPTIAGHSRVEMMYEASDKRRYYVPCPHCGHMQVLKFKDHKTGEHRLKWEPGQPETTWYECEAKGCRIENHDKTWMLERGEWRSEAQGYRGNVAGFHLSSLYSPVGWFSWQEIAAMFEEAKKNPDLLKVFVNTVLGEVWQEEGEALEWERLYSRREDYEAQVPLGGLFLTAGADVQKDRIEVEVVAWGRNFETWSVAYYVFPGDTSELSGAPWKALDELLTRQYQHEFGSMLSISCLAVDTGYNAQVVYNWCRRYPITRVMPVKGSATQSVMVGQPKAVDVVINGKKKQKALKLWVVGVSLIKSELMGWLKMNEPAPGEESPIGWCHFPTERGEEWFMQLTAEYLDIQEVRGRRVIEWKKVRQRNEALDCRVYARAAASLMQIDNFTERHWVKIERSIYPADGVPVQAQAQASRPEPVIAPKKQGRRVMSRGVSV